MKAIRFAAISILLMIVHSPLARAQEQELPQPLRMVAGFLQLSEAQLHDLVTIIQTRDAAIAPIAQGVQSNQAALAKLLEGETPDPSKVGQLLIEIHNDEKRAAGIAQAAAASFADTLTADQKQRMAFVIQAAQVAPVIPAFKAIGLI